MIYSIKKLIFVFTYNSCLFFILIIGIQNSSNKSKVNLFFNETVNLPVSFIVGSSFIAGTIFGALLPLNSPNKNH